MSELLPLLARSERHIQETANEIAMPTKQPNLLSVYELDFSPPTTESRGFATT